MTGALPGGRFFIIQSEVFFLTTVHTLASGSSGNAALLTVRAVLQMVGHLDGILRHDQRIDFFSLPQFFLKQFPFSLVSVTASPKR